MPDLAQIFESVNMGLVVLDRELKVRHWNRWMESHSAIPAEQIVGCCLFDHFPDLHTAKFLRGSRSVLAFGGFSYFSQKLHRYLFPFRPESAFESRFDRMQQSCVMGPLRDDAGAVTGLYLTVQDVTELASYEHRLLEMNMRDGLTGVYNRRFLETRLDEEFERYKRYDRDFSLILFDIDFFKKVNDGYGHQCGDLVLKNVAGTINAMIRKTDFLARYGGEEFCCLLPETSLEAATLLAERFRAAIAADTHTYLETELRVTISLGVSKANAADPCRDSLVRRVDEALYGAKGAGRNRVVVLPC
jgi:diguanylate cyclase (GGDEF)-like protein